MQTLRDIQQLLAGHGLRPKHRLGQNFLHDANHMQRIVDAAELEAGDLVLEVGPGTGALTVCMLETPGVRLVAIEVDDQLQPILAQQIEPFGDRATLLIGDVLAGKHRLNPAVFEALREQAALASTDVRPAEDDGDPQFKLVANLPYNVASPLLANLAIDHPQMTLAVVMIQREVADRLTAPPGGKAYGPLGVLMQAMCHVQRVATLSPACFWPQPKVASAVIRLQRRRQPLTDDPHALAASLQRLFGQRRKQLGSILGRQTALPDGVSSDARPEQLTVEQHVQVAKLITL